MSAPVALVETHRHVRDEAEIPPGYDWTEIGDLPNDWSVISLGDRAHFRTGPFGSALHKSDYTNGDVPVINPMHIIDNKLIPTESMTLVEEAAKQLAEFRLRDGDIIIGRRGDMGRCAVVQPRQAGWLCGTGSLIVRCADGLVPEFIQRVLSSPRVVAAITDASVGSTMTNLNQGVLARLRVQSPPEKEQRAIAEALADVDELIGVLEKLIAKKRAIKQGAMQQLLTGKTRLPGFETAWESRTLGELCWSITDGTHFTPHYVDDGVPFYSVENVTADNFTNTKFISAREHKLLIKRCKPEKGDILLTRIGALGDTKFVDWNIDASIYVSLALLKVKDHVDARYLYCYTKSKHFVEDLEARSLMNASPKKINMGDIGSVPVPVPELEEQHAIAAVLSDMDAEIAALERRREKTKSIKLGMTQSLLTGRVRLVNPESKA